MVIVGYDKSYSKKENRKNNKMSNFLAVIPVTQAKFHVVMAF